MAPPVQQGLGTFQGAISALTVPWPAAGLLSGDVALLIVESANQAITLSTPAGFTEETNSPQGHGTAGAATGVRLALFWHRATGTTMTSPVVADSGDHQTAQIVTFRGCVTSGNPIDAAFGDIGSAATSIQSGQLTPSVTDTLAVYCLATDRDIAGTANFSAWNSAALGAMAEHIDQGISGGAGGGIGCASVANPDGWPTGLFTATQATAVNWALLAVALKSTTSIPIPARRVPRGALHAVTRRAFY